MDVSPRIDFMKVVAFLCFVHKCVSSVFACMIQGDANLVLDNLKGVRLGGSGREVQEEGTYVYLS